MTTAIRPSGSRGTGGRGTDSTATGDGPPAGGLLRLEDALARMLDGVEPLALEKVELADAHGRVLGEAIDSRLTLPPWDNSAMDGFAVRAADTAAASATSPVRLRVAGEVAAGVAPAARVEPGTALRILTGAPLPEGADAVVPVEQTDAAAGVAELPASVGVLAAVEPGAHVRRAGSDIGAGARLLDAGRELGPAELALAAAGGHGQLAVHRRPLVAVLATGDELVAPGRPLGAAQIPDSNSIGLAAQAREAGAVTLALGISRDRRADVVVALRRALDDGADVIVVSGGVSVGAHDVVKDAFAEVGRIDLWRVAVQPGKPLAFGRAGGALLFGLPGNPVSSLVTFELFVRPVLRRLGGQRDATDAANRADRAGREVVRATLSEPVRKDPARRAFLRVRLARVADGDASGALWSASLAGGQGSHVLSALAAADGLAIVPEGLAELPAGAVVEVLRLRQ